MAFEYRVIRSRRKTISIQIKAAGEVVVRSPQRMPESAIRSFVESKGPWIEKHLAKQRALPQLPMLTESERKALVEKAKTVLSQRVAHFAPLVGVDYGRITIRTQHTRWGSCSTRGNLNFNCLLMLAPLEVVDYVVVHELCHRKEMNHSPLFWAEVERVLPHYREPRKWLKEHGPALIRRIP